MSPDPISQQVMTSMSQSLQLGDRSAEMSLEAQLLGHLPELDSMAALTVRNLIGLVRSRIEQPILS